MRAERDCQKVTSLTPVYALRGLLSFQKLQTTSTFTRSCAGRALSFLSNNTPQPMHYLLLTAIEGKAIYEYDKLILDLQYQKKGKSLTWDGYSALLMPWYWWVLSSQQADDFNQGPMLSTFLLPLTPAPDLANLTSLMLIWDGYTNYLRWKLTKSWSKWESDSKRQERSLARMRLVNIPHACFTMSARDVYAQEQEHKFKGNCPDVTGVHIQNLHSNISAHQWVH